MANHRVKKIGRRVLEELSELVVKGVKDPRIGMVTFIEIDLSPDYKYATIYYSVMGGDAARVKECQKGLESATKFFEYHLMKNLQIKFTPNLTFKFDTGLEHSDKINRIINEINKGPKSE